MFAQVHTYYNASLSAQLVLEFLEDHFTYFEDEILTS